MIDRRQLLALVVRPALVDLVPLGVQHSLGAEQLLMGTAAVESAFEFLAQKGGGPALGLWQMEGPTHDDIWKNFLHYRQALGVAISGPTAAGPSWAWPRAERLIWDLRYACQMARLQYFRGAERLPAGGDLAGMEALYLKRYNAGGKSRPGEFTRLYGDLVASLF